MISSIKFLCLFSLIDRKKLTDVMIFNLSQRITSESALRNLATIGLKLPDFFIDTQLHDRSHSINEAALKVLKEWNKKNDDPFQAYDALCDAFKKAGMPYLIHEVL